MTTPADDQRDDAATPETVSPLVTEALSLYGAGKHEEAEAKARAALEANGKDAAAWLVLAYALTARGQAARAYGPQDEGLRAAKQAHDLCPGVARYAEGYLTLLSMRRRPEEMLRVAQAWYARDPVGLSAVTAYAGALQECGMFDQSREKFAEAAAISGDDIVTMSRWAAASNYDDGISAVERAAIHARSGAAYAALPGQTNPTYTNSKDPERKLRVAIISPDLRRHSCAFFLEPLLENLDKSAFEVYLYYTMGPKDEVTARFKALAKGFRHFVPQGSATEGMPFKIWTDRIDVLIDTAGHTDGNRLHVMQTKPAPVSVTYLGYPNTTGLRTIGHRIVDSITDPPGSEGLASETLVRVDPCFVCYRPPEEASGVDVDPTPPVNRGSGAVTFGCFNNAIKVTRTTIGLWAAAMNAVHGSRLVLKSGSYGDEIVRRRVSEAFAEHGVSANRLVFEDATESAAAHLAKYNGIDIALDTMPYNGTTTTCEALWMGVPVLTSLGDFHAARVSASLLHAVGLSDLVAKDAAEFTRLAAGLAGDAGRLGTLRRELRGRMAASPLCDGKGYAERFGGALRTMWRAWCAGKS
jgi:predicted O-linked N-acetylglucosamine transferase (SPINDLY family)